ncbi:MAG: ATP-binding protein, partial [Chloroflexota bacterium]|nr:ATP-binding protein [Chloroflexota bacterium]
LAVLLPVMAGLIHSQRDATVAEAAALSRMRVAASLTAERISATVHHAGSSARAIEGLPGFWDGADADRDAVLGALADSEPAFNGLTFFDALLEQRGSSLTPFGLPRMRPSMEFVIAAAEQHVETFAPRTLSSAANGAIILPMAVPVQDRRTPGQTGVLAISLKVDQLPGLADSVDLQSGGSVLLVDRRDQRVVATSDGASNLVGSAVPISTGGLDRAEFGGGDTFLVTEAVPATPWSTVVAVPSAAVLGPIYREAWASILTTSLMAALAVLVLLSIWAHVSRGVERLQSAAEAWSRGQLDYRADTGAGDELARLATAFNRMAADLQQTVAQLTAQAVLLDLAHDAIIVRDAHGAIQYWNHGAEQMYGWRREEVMGRDLAAVLQSRGDATPEAVTAEFASRGRWEGELVERRRDGSTITVASRWARQTDERGNLVATLVINTDVTERQAVNRLKAEFVSVVSHELRTPLTSIRGSLGLLAGGLLGPMPPKGQRLLDIAVSNTDRLIRLINDILDMERMESGLVKMDKRACDAADLFEEAMELMRPIAEAAGVSLVLRSTTAPLWADPDRMQQMLSNLLSNAIKFSPAGGEVVLEARDRGADVLISVSDQGRGIPPENLESIFERFHQVDASDSREKGGTGLGLAICRSIVQQHEGHIWVESAVGKGSTFFVELPVLGRSEHRVSVHDDGPAHGRPCDEERAGQDSASGRARRPRALVVEDDPDLAQVLLTMCEHQDVDVLYAPTGEAAIEVGTQHAFDVLLLDVALPGCDGFMVVEQLDANQRLRDVPVIVYTALDLNSADRRRLRFGNTEFLTKGRVSPARLAERIAAVTRERMTGRAESA